jgi:threonine dehydrogenase-like Zn-dependent dehydrogenase
MQAITVTPGRAGSGELRDLAPPGSDGGLLVEALCLGVCGTDREILAGEYGEAPQGEEQLVLGHELLGVVREAASGFSRGDLVAGIVRRPDPVPCACCARGEWDMCRNGLYTECGIKGRHGFGAEVVALEPEFAVPLEPSLARLGVLTEPTSVVAKAWQQIDRLRERACLPLKTVLVTGAGPIGLLAALLATQRGLDVHVLDRAAGGPKPELVEALGASYHRGGVEEACGEDGAEIIVECTGAAQVVVDAMRFTAPGAIVCLAGVSARGRVLDVDLGELNNELVLENDLVFGSVNANRRHFEAAASALAAADRDWLEGVVSRRVPVDRWHEAVEPREDDVKTVIEFA